MVRLGRCRGTLCDGAKVRATVRVVRLGRCHRCSKRTSAPLVPYHRTPRTVPPRRTQKTQRISKKHNQFCKQHTQVCKKHNQCTTVPPVPHRRNPPSVPPYRTTQYHRTYPCTVPRTLRTIPLYPPYRTTVPLSAALTWTPRAPAEHGLRI